MELLESLIYLTKSSTLRKLSGEPKRLYKYAIVATFFNIVNGKQLQYGQYEINEKKINETHVIEDIILPKFITDTVEKTEFESLYREYNLINDIRNSIIHTSAFEDKSNQRYFMELFFETPDFSNRRKISIVNQNLVFC